MVDVPDQASRESPSCPGWNKDAAASARPGLRRNENPTIQSGMQGGRRHFALAMHHTLPWPAFMRRLCLA